MDYSAYYYIIQIKKSKLFYYLFQIIEALVITPCTLHITIGFLLNDKVLFRPLFKLPQDISTHVVVTNHTAYAYLGTRCLKLWFYHRNYRGVHTRYLGDIGQYLP